MDLAWRDIESTHWTHRDGIGDIGALLYQVLLTDAIQTCGSSSVASESAGGAT